MKVIDFLVAELQSEMHSGCEMQLFEKIQCFYVAMINVNVSIYYSASLRHGQLINSALNAKFE